MYVGGRGSSALHHLAIEVTDNAVDEVILFTNRGRGWRGTVGFVPAEGGAKELGLERDERVISLAVLRPGAYLVMGTRGGKVKRTSVSDLSIPYRDWRVVMGLAGGDELLFGDVAGEGAHVLFYTAQGQLLRLDGDAVNPQQTNTATGVVGIRLRKGDRLLGGWWCRMRYPSKTGGTS
jgi:DNA gyrase subunit A